MDYNLLSNLQYCGDIVSSMAPLLLYTHVPSALIALIIGTYVLYQTRTRDGVLLFALAAVFALWVSVNLTLWFVYDRNTLMIAFWSLNGLISAWIFLLTHWFAHRYIVGAPLPLPMLVIWTVALLPVIIFTPTFLNLSGVEIRDCVASEGSMFTNYYYALGLLAMLLLSVSAFMGSRQRRAA